MKRHARKDPVTPELRNAVMERDSWDCVAPQLGATDACADRHGGPINPWHGLTLDHVRDQPMMGKRAPSDMRHLVTICWHHHLDGWATAHRPELREYLRLVGERGEAA